MLMESFFGVSNQFEQIWCFLFLTEHCFNTNNDLLELNFIFLLEHLCPESVEETWLFDQQAQILRFNAHFTVQSVHSIPKRFFLSMSRVVNKLYKPGLVEKIVGGVDGEKQL